MVERPSGPEGPADQAAPIPTGPGPSAPSTPVEPARPGSGPEGRAHRFASLHEVPVLILLAIGLAIVLKTLVVQAFYIPSGSMEPTLEPGDRVLVNKVLYTPGRGDIIVFEDPNGRGADRGIVGGFLHWLSEGLGFARPEHEDFIKRVIGLPGETVELRNGKLFIDGLRTPEPYLKGLPVDIRDFGPVTVPGGSLFVLGDNRRNSNDSRFGLGFVPIDRVVGRAFVVIWPPSRVRWLR